MSSRRRLAFLALRLSIWKVRQILRNLLKQSKNRPVFLVGLPKAIHMAFGVVIAPSVTSQITSSMADASSYSTSTCFSWVPAKFSGAFLDHGIAWAYHISGYRACSSLVAVQTNQCPLIDSLFHFASSRHVLLVSWSFLPAVTTICGNSRVLMNHRMIQLMSAVLPMPWPDATANSMGRASATSMPSRTALPSSSRKVICHSSGPASSASRVPFLPHGNTYSTNPSGSA